MQSTVIVSLLGGLFLYAGLAKLCRAANFFMVVRGWGFRSRRAGIALARGLPAVEVALGAAALTAAASGRGVALAAQVLLAMLAAFLVAQIWIGRRAGRVPCGCGVGPTRIGFASYVRTGLLLSLAALAALP
jgi:hypothetical protein